MRFLMWLALLFFFALLIMGATKSQIPPIYLLPNQCVNASMYQDNSSFNVTICSSGICNVSQTLLTGTNFSKVEGVCNISINTTPLPCVYNITTNQTCNCSYPTNFSCVPQNHTYNYTFNYSTNCREICNITEHMICDIDDVNITGQVEEIVCPNVTCPACPSSCVPCPPIPMQEIFRKIDELKVTQTPLIGSGDDNTVLFIVIIIVIGVSLFLFVIWLYFREPKESREPSGTPFRESYT